MCSRFELSRCRDDVIRDFALKIPPPWPNGREFRPTDRALVIAKDGAMLLRWGLSVEWENRPLINARVETVRDRPTFRRLLGNRVLVPASAWWEWNGQKLKTRLAPATDQLMAFAGLRDGDTFVILTRAASPALAPVHDRMPLLADGRWLDGGAPQVVETEIIATIDQPVGRQPDLFG